MEIKNLLSILGKSFPTTTGYDTVGTVTQANAEGYRLILTPDSTDIFCKRVDASQYAHKSWPDFRRTLMYLRTEIAFYKHICPLLQERGFDAIPTIYDCDYDLEGLIPEDSKATDQSGGEPADWAATAAEGKGGYIVMESIGEPYFQDSPITVEQAKETLSAVAALHAAAWEDTALLETAEQWLSRGSYHLKTRNVKELAGMTQAWENFSTSFQHLDPDLFESTKDMGKRIQDLAEYLCEEVSPGPTDPYATLPHGDFKSMNCFLPNGGSRGVVLVDFASTGVGLGMSDVAMHIHHAVRPEDLENGGEEELWDHYYNTLCDLLGPTREYPRDVALRHYRLTVCDYFRFFLGRFWKSATPEAMEKKKDSKNTALINRNVDSALAFLRRVEKYVTQVENERATCNQQS
jgi:hypothetical protein